MCDYVVCTSIIMRIIVYYNRISSNIYIHDIGAFEAR